MYAQIVPMTVCAILKARQQCVTLSYVAPLQASLLLSPVPTLHGNFPLSVSLVLRMLSLVAATCDSSLGKKADLATKDDMLRLLQRPFYAAGKDPALQQKMQHLFRFAVDYLMRQRMLTFNAR